MKLCQDITVAKFLNLQLIFPYSGLTVDNIMNFCVVALKHNCHDVRQVAERIIKAYYLFLKTYAAISNAHLFRVCKRGKLSGSCLSTLNGFGSIQLPIFLCHIGVRTFSSQNK